MVEDVGRFGDLEGGSGSGVWCQKVDSGKSRIGMEELLTAFG